MSKHIPILIISKIIISLSTLYFFAVYLGWDMFTYPDFSAAYSNCSSDSWINRPYGKIFCSLSSITGQEITYKSPIFIFIATLINMAVLIGYFLISQRYLNEYGKYLLIALFVIHPYMNVYFFRFYTDIFATLGIFLIFFYKANNKNIDLLFVLLSLMLMNLRVALIPVFFIYAIWEIFSFFRSGGKKIIFPFLLFIIALISYIPVMSFSYRFANINSDINLFIKVIFNLIYTMGFRESVAVTRVFIAEYEIIDLMSLFTSFILIIVHTVGLFGFIKFAAMKRDISFLIVFVYLVVPIIAIGHMRYLLPLMPILLFGFSYLFFRKEKYKKSKQIL